MPYDDEPSGDPTLTGAPRTGSLDSGSRTHDSGIRPGGQVGRFHVLERIGAGGMGQVHAAYDPNLDRKIALKVLHEERDAKDDPRLVREAQALARLSHPNVVAVHDVGTHDGRLFVAMEFVEGVTLREWLQRHPPPGSAERLGEVLELLVQAGEGLAAAHRAGLVHRDFKPSNVLIGADGRVRVVDFGVVRVDEPRGGKGRRHLEVVRDEEPSPPPEGNLLDLVSDAPLTRPGALVGTPAYMAPEQLLSLAANAACDQFGFCVTAWEMIFGGRPFTGKTIPALLESIRKGQVTRSFEVECPDEIEKALRKGLAFAPKGRHRSMDALLGVLQRAQARMRGEAVPPLASKRWLWLGAMGLTGTVGAATLVLAQDDSQLCTGAASHLVGAWDDATKAELEQAFLRTEAGFAPEAWGRFERELDGYAEAWIAGHRDACEAARVRGEQSTELMDLRMACLDARRRSLAALTEVYAEPDAEMLVHSDEAIAALEPIAACADLEHVRHRGELPKDGEAATQAEAILARVARSVALEGAGRYAEALELASEAVEDANRLGSDAVLARALVQRGKVHVHERQGEPARENLEQAYLLAKRADLPEVAFESARSLIQVDGILLMRFGEGRWWAKVGLFEGEHVVDERKARLHVDLGALLRSEGRFVEAEESYERAVDLLRRSVGAEHLAYASALQALGELRAVKGGPDRALPLLREAMEIAELNLGAAHPSMGRFHTSVAEGFRLQGDLDQALEHARQAVELAEEAFGTGHVALYPVLDELASVQEDRGEIEAALATLERARGLHRPEPIGEAFLARLYAREGEIRFQRHDYPGSEQAFRRASKLGSDALGDTHPYTTRYRIGLGAAVGAQGRREEAIAIIEAGRAIGEAMLGGQHPNVAVTHDALASEMEQAGRLDEALEHTKRALEIYEAAYGEDGFQLMKPHGNMCGILGQLGRVEPAVEHCQRALELAKASVSSDRSLMAKLHNNLGAALVAAHRWDDALRHYEEAREIWEQELGPRHLMVAIVLANLAEAHAAKGRHERAHELYSDSLAIREQELGAEHPMVVVPLIGLANAALARGEAGEAVELGRRAVAVAEGKASELVLARAEEMLARALWSEPGGRREASELAGRAKKSFERLGAQAQEDRVRLAAWWPR
ncbi:serine/threonine-protein kinase [Paraliomyxa miuraensis]|uniref:serine/threonine-protein kinase n=1 Tax=Paraliomyxa miuraensis TaxID=376150 RepID=UPI00225B5BFA|nr:serine/threonine-protein kinase [Paraliomyxa miuraensis]MCX4244190.1 serine/threonine-protein kinase [Paraliomyxa miuraensis]